MLKNDLIRMNPLRALEPDAGAGRAPSRTGLVIGRRGAGKTAVLVQVAIDGILRGSPAVHVSIGQNIDRAKAWYEDLFQELSRTYRLDHVGEVHDEIARGRMIMSFQATSFSVPKLEERLNDLVQQNIFHPGTIVIDGLDFAHVSADQVRELREFSAARRLHTWCSAVRHREEPRVSARGVPAPCDAFEDIFDTIVLLDPETEGTTLRVLKNTVAGGATRQLSLDPKTFLVRKRC